MVVQLTTFVRVIKDVETTGLCDKEVIVNLKTVTKLVSKLAVNHSEVIQNFKLVQSSGIKGGFDPSREDPNYERAVDERDAYNDLKQPIVLSITLLNLTNKALNSFANEDRVGDQGSILIAVNHSCDVVT